jgi:large subunit ribosomal protein LP2
VGVEVDDANLSKLLADLEGKNIDELIEAGKPMIVKLGGGGGGGGGGGAAGSFQMRLSEEKKRRRKKKRWTWQEVY